MTFDPSPRSITSFHFLGHEERRDTNPDNKFIANLGSRVNMGSLGFAMVEVICGGCWRTKSANNPHIFRFPRRFPIILNMFPGTAHNKGFGVEKTLCFQVRCVAKIGEKKLRRGDH